MGLSMWRVLGGAPRLRKAHPAAAAFAAAVVRTRAAAGLAEQHLAEATGLTAETIRKSSSASAAFTIGEPNLIADALATTLDACADARAQSSTDLLANHWDLMRSSEWSATKELPVAADHS
jgi:hypothetical protein